MRNTRHITLLSSRSTRPRKRRPTPLIPEINVRIIFIFTLFFIHFNIVVVIIAADKIDKASNWWIHSITGNYLSRWYRYTIVDVRKFQKELEATLFATQAQAEAEAVALATQQGDSAAASYLQRFHDQTAAQVRDDWWAFFFRMVGVYRCVDACVIAAAPKLYIHIMLSVYDGLLPHCPIALKCLYVILF